MPDYSILDKPELIGHLFYPRKDFNESPEYSSDFPVRVDEHISITCRLYKGDKNWPWILYFHGNGEVVSDYDYIAALYFARKLNLAVADYRGYGKSNGTPGFENMIKDAHSIFNEIRNELTKKYNQASLWVMGRSLGSISALELAYNYPREIKGLIIESGFASVTRLIKHLGIPAYGIDLDKLEKECLEMITKIMTPALLIHGQRDSLVPINEGKLILKNLGTQQKDFVIIPHADHNSIIFRDIELYFGAVEKFIYD